MAELFSLPKEQVFDNNGNPLASATLSFFVTGTSTPLDTYSDNGLTVANANPVVADSAGRFNSIYLQNADYKAVLKDSGGSTIWSADPIHGGAANPLFSSILVDSGNDTLDSSDNGKLIAVTATATITLPAATVGTSYRVGIVNAGAGIVTVARAGSDTFETGQTAVRLAPAQGAFFQPDGTSKWYTVGKDGRGKGADIASAAALNLGQDGHYFHVTGTTTITSIEARPRGWEIVLTFDDAVIVTHNASTLIMPGAANFTTAAGDCLTFTAEDDSGAWRCTAVALAGSIGFDVSALTAEVTPADGTFVAGSIGAGSGNNRKFAVEEVGGMALLETQAASASASIIFDLSAYSEYAHFKVIATGVLAATDAQNLQMHVSTDGGSNYDSSAGNYGYTNALISSAAISQISNSATSILFTGSTATMGNGTGETLTLELLISEPATATLHPQFNWTVGYRNSTPHVTSGRGFGQRFAAQITTHIRFTMTSGNITSGTFKLYGIRG